MFNRITCIICANRLEYPHFQKVIAYDKQLDLVFPTDYSKIAVTENIYYYHPPLDIFYQVDDIYTETIEKGQYFFNFNKAAYNLLNTLIIDNFNDLGNCLNFDCLDDAVEHFYKVIFNCIFESVPISLKRNSFSSYPWYNKDLKLLRNKRNKWWKKYVLSQDITDLENYKTFDGEFKLLNSRLYDVYLKNTNLKLLFDPKYFWAFINIKKKSDGYPSSFIDNSRVVNDPEIISGLFANLFKSCFVADNFNPDVNYFQHLKTLTKVNLEEIVLDHNTILRELLSLDNDLNSRRIVL